MKVKPDLSFWKLWTISFGFFGVQIAYAHQSANISRIFATLGAELPATRHGPVSDDASPTFLRVRCWRYG